MGRLLSHATFVVISSSKRLQAKIVESIVRKVRSTMAGNAITFSNKHLKAINLLCCHCIFISLYPGIKGRVITNYRALERCNGFCDCLATNLSFSRFLWECLGKSSLIPFDHFDTFDMAPLFYAQLFHTSANVRLNSLTCECLFFQRRHASIPHINRVIADINHCRRR